MHIIVVIERIQKLRNFFAGLIVKVRSILCHVTNLRRENIPPGGFKRFRYGIQISNRSEEPCAVLSCGNFILLQRLDLLRSRLDRVGLRIAA